jgi:hypothetical protein
MANRDDQSDKDMFGFPRDPNIDEPTRRDEWGDEQDARTKPRSGWGCVIWSLILFGTFSCLCCVGSIASVYMVTPQIVSTSGEVKKITAEIIDSPIPADYEPQMAAKWLFFGVIGVRGAMYTNKLNQAFLGVMRFHGFNKNASEFADGVRNEITTQMSNGEEDEESVLISTEMMLIKMDYGPEIEFKNDVVEKKEGKSKQHRIVGILPNIKPEIDAETMVIFIINEDKWNEEEAIQFMQKLKPKD